MSDTRILQKPRKTKKKTKWQNLCPSGYQNIAKTSKNQKKQKKQNGRTYVPVSGMGSVLLFFWVFWFSQVKPKKQKKQNGRTYVPVSGMGSVLLVFLVFPGKTKKKQKKQNGRTYVPVSGMGSVLLVFLVFLVFPGKTKKTKKTKWQNLCPSGYQNIAKTSKNQKKTKKQNGRTYVPVSGMGSVLLFFLFFLVFPGKTKKNKKKTKWQNLCPSVWHGVSTFVFLCFFGFCRGFCNFLVSDMGSAILLFCFSRFFQYSAFPKKTLVSFPKKTFFS